MTSPRHIGKVKGADGCWRGGGAWRHAKSDKTGTKEAGVESARRGMKCGGTAHAAISTVLRSSNKSIEGLALMRAERASGSSSSSDNSSGICKFGPLFPRKDSPAGSMSK